MVKSDQEAKEKPTLDTSAACEYKQKAGQLTDGRIPRVTEKTFCLVRRKHWGHGNKIHHNRLSVNHNSLECTKKPRGHKIYTHTQCSYNHVT